MKGSETYQRILETAYELFAGQGYEKTSLAMISNRVGISKPALYYHFTSKEALFEVLYVHLIEGMKKEYRIGQWPGDKASLIQFLIDKGYSDIAYLEEKPAFPSILRQYSLLGKRSETIRRLTRDLEEAVRSYYVDLMAHAVSLGLVDQEDSGTLVELLILMDGGILEKSEELGMTDLKAMWATFIRKMLG